jgi:probable rRNA maturation factor
MMIPTIDIAIESPLWRPMTAVTGVVEQAVTSTLQAVEINLRPAAELSVLLCDDARIHALNREWRNIDAATNVLAFPAVAAEQLSAAEMLGDIVLAFETIEREARRDSKSFEDHLRHLIVHALLHLLGHDHRTGGEAEQMEAVERRVLRDLNIADPYCETDPLETPIR